MFPADGVIPFWCVLIPTGIEVVWLWMFVPRLMRDSLEELASTAGEPVLGPQPPMNLWVGLSFIAWHVPVLPIWLPLMLLRPGPWPRLVIGTVMLSLTPLLHACWLAGVAWVLG